MALAMLVAFWLIARIMCGSATAADRAYTCARASYLAFPLIPAALLQFACVAAGTARYRRLTIPGWVIGAAFSALSLTKWGIIAGVWRYSWGFFPRYGAIAPLFLAYLGTLCAMSISVLIHAVRGLPHSRQRRRLTQFAIAYAAGVLGAADFLPAYGIPIFPNGPFAVLATIVLLDRSIRKYQLHDITAAFAAENIISTMSDALIVTDDEGWIRITNDAACVLTGFERRELVGSPLGFILAAAIPGDTELLTKLGVSVPVSITVSALREGTHAAARVIIARDVRERRRIEGALRTQELRFQTEEVRRQAELEYRSLVESMHEGVIHFDRNGLIRYINDCAATMIGVRRQEALGASIVDLVGGELLDHLIAGTERSLAGESERHEISLPKFGGEVLWIEIGRSPVVAANGDVAGSICILTDVTERRLTDQRLAASARQWQQTFDAIQTPLVIVGRNGIVRRANLAACELAGIDRDLVGLPIHDFGPDALWPEIGRLAGAGAHTQRAQFEDEETGLTWDIVIDVLNTEEGGPELAVVARDITPFIELQKSLRHNETMSTLGALVGGVAHEVRNPLFVISSTLDAFAQIYGDRDEYRHFSKVMRKEIDRVSNLMSGLLELGRPAPAVLTRREVGPVMDEAIALCIDEARLAGVTIARECDLESAPVRMDERRLLQAFRNLIHNAVQHSPSGGTVTVRIAHSHREGVILCAVLDDGPGFRREDVRRVFEPFFSRRKGGTGLGLSIARAVVVQHLGTVAAANLPEGGGIVSIELPLADHELA